jgi:hypothetical protein
VWLSKFELLKSLWWEVLTKPWVLKANREVAGMYFKIVCMWEEIECLNFKISCLQRWVGDKDAHLLATATALEVSQPALACEIYHLHNKCVHINNVHHAHLQAIYAMPGFSGVCVLETSDDANAGAVIDELQSVVPIEVDEDDLLCDKAAYLKLCIA